MKARFDRLSPQEEARSLLVRFSGDIHGAISVIEKQLAVILTRAQVLVTVATLTLTISGFSGPRMAASGQVSLYSLMIGITFVLASLLLVMFGSLQVRWLTQIPHESNEKTLIQAILYRKLKTKIFKIELVLLGLGLTFYVTGVVAFLFASPDLAVK